jgi:hypothetical protein
MAVTVEQVNVLVTAEVDRALKELNKIDKAPKKIETSFKSLAKAIAGPAAAGLIVKAFVDISKKSAKLAADAEEVRAKFSSVFGTTADEVNAWATEYSEAVGRSETDTLKFLGTIGDTLKPLGFAKDAVDGMSKQVVELANDLSSFNNLPTEEVIAGIQSALVGNVETLRRYGVVANEAAIQQEAINSGISETGKNLTAQEKAQAILNITLKGTTDAQGDLRRTQNSAANVQRALNSAVQESQEIYGSILNTVLTPWRAEITRTIKETNKLIQTEILRQKVASEEASTVEELLLVNTRISEAQKELARRKDTLAVRVENLNNVTDAEISRQRTSREALERRIEVEKTAIAQTEARITSLSNNAAGLSDQIVQEKEAAQALIDAATALDENTAATDENTESKEKNGEAAFRNIGYEEAMTAQLTFASRAFTEATDSADDYTDALLSTEEVINNLTAIGFSSLLSGFEQIGAALAQGELSYKSFGKVALQSVGNVLSALGDELTARAVIALLAGNFAGAALAGGGATAAYLAAGIVKSQASALAEGGTFTTNGPTPLLVGDNVGGQERVTVEPVSSNGANVMGGMPSGPITLVVDGRPFTAHFQRQIDNRNLHSSRGGAI